MSDIELKNLITVQTQLIAAQTGQLAVRDEKIAELTDKVSSLLLHIPHIFTQNETPKKSNEGGNEDMAFYVPKGCSLFQRNDGRWVGRVHRKTVACRFDKKFVYDKVKKTANEIKKKRVKKDKELTLFAWLDQWHTVFRMPKLESKELSENTIIMDKSMIRKIKEVFKDKKLKDLTADYIQERLYSMTQGRTCEGVYTILKLALAKAKDRTGGINIMDMVEKVKHERQRGRALTKDEINRVLEAASNEAERDIIKFYIYTGCRVGEIIDVKVKHINLAEEPRIITGLKHKGKTVADMVLMPNEVFIYGTKTKLSIRTMPIMPPLKPVLERLIKDRDGDESLFNFTVPMIRYFYRKIKADTNIDFTLKDFRHTCATSFKDAGIPSGVYFRWFGWCDDTMAKRVYTHVTDYEQKVSQEWASKFEREN